MTKRRLRMNLDNSAVREEFEREKNPNNQKRNTKPQPPPNSVQRVQHNSNRTHRRRNSLNSNNLKPNNPIRKKGLCYYIGKLGHFKRVCRKKIADDKRRQNNSGIQHNSRQGKKSWHDQNQMSGNSTQNNWNETDHNINKSDVQALISEV